MQSVLQNDLSTHVYCKTLLLPLWPEVPPVDVEFLDQNCEASQWPHQQFRLYSISLNDCYYKLGLKRIF